MIPGLKLGSQVLNGFYRGDVVDTADPKKLGRVRVRVEPWFHYVLTEHLPWSVPAMGLFAGAGPGFGGFAVPSAGSAVFCFFEASNPYQPVYFAEAQTGKRGVPADASANYPDTRVWRTPAGVQFSVNDAKQEIMVDHPSGTYVKILQTGAMEIGAVPDIAAAAGTDARIVTGKDASVWAGANVLVTAGEMIGLQAGSIVLNALNLALNATVISVLVDGDVIVAAPSVQFVTGFFDIIGSLNVQGPVTIAGEVTVYGEVNVYGNMHLNGRQVVTT